MKRDVSILIPVKNEIRWIAPCLDAVFRQNEPPFEVIVVDSGSTDGTLQVLKRYPLRLVQIPPEDFHHARTRNLAASLAQGQTLVFLGGDAIPASNDWLKQLVAPLTDPRVAAAYGRQVPREGAGLERRAAFAQMYGESPIRKHRDRASELGYRLYHFSTVTCAIPRSVWERYPFPEDQPVFEDIGFAKKVLDDGWAIAYEPTAVVIHSHDYSAAQLFRRFYDTGAVWGRLGIWRACQGASKTLRRDAWATVRRKLRRGGPVSPALVAPGLARDAAKAAGLWLGKRERWLPMPLKRRLTAFEIYGPPPSHRNTSRQKT